MWTRFFVFDKGEIVASGKFNDLVATNDIVARFVELSNPKLQIKKILNLL